MKFGLFLAMHYKDTARPYGRLLDDALEMVVKAEELGFDSVFIPEHHFISYITMPSALQFAVKASTVTSRIRFVTAVLVLPYYHPMALAENIAQADWLTGGRIEAGLARGATSYEFERLGLDFSHSREMFEEGLDIMLKAWRTKNLSYDGKFYRFPPTTLIPEPLQKPHPPVWITAQSLPGARGVAKWGANLLTMPNYNSFAPFEDVVTLLGEFHSAGGGNGTEVGLVRKVFIGETEEEAMRQVDHFVRHWRMYMSAYEARLDRRLEERVDRKVIGLAGDSELPMPMEIDLPNLYEKYDAPIITSPEKAVARIRRYEQLGITQLIINTAVGPAHRDVMSSLELFGREVIPHFKGAVSPA